MCETEESVWVNVPKRPNKVEVVDPLLLPLFLILPVVFVVLVAVSVQAKRREAEQS